MLHEKLIHSLLLILFTSIACCADLACFFENGQETIIKEEALISPYDGSKILNFTVASSYEDALNLNPNAKGENTTIAEVKRRFDERVDLGNDYVINKATSLAIKLPGPYTISQIYLIHDNITEGWHYLYDPRGKEYYRYANQSLKELAGDCDDFAILMSSLIENIGGKTRIILANGPEGSHAYAEVYLGNNNTDSSDVFRVIKWLENKYHEKIYYHKDNHSGSIWLNLDWGPDNPYANPRIGGPFFKATDHTIVFIGDAFTGLPVKPPNEPPNAVMMRSKSNPLAIGEEVEFDASNSTDPDNNIMQYEWNFGDNTENETGMVVRHAYRKNGTYSISLTVTDAGKLASKDSEIIIVKDVINSPPEEPEIITDHASPQVAGTDVTFTASASDPENDQVEYMFLLDNQKRTDFTENPIWTWTTAEQDLGSHTIEVRARDNNHNPNGDSSHTTQFTIEAESNNPPVATNMAADHESPVVAGASINFSATASDPENDLLQYMFLLDSRAKTDFSDSSSWIWNTTAQDIGIHIIEVRVRDNNHDQEGDSSKTIEFYVKDNGSVYENTSIEAITNYPPKLDNLTADFPSPQDAGTVINWTAQGIDPENDSLVYRFFLDGKPVTVWDSQNKWTWDTINSEPGDHQIEVHVRDGMHADEETFDDKIFKPYKLIRKITGSDLESLPILARDLSYKIRR